MTRAAVLKVVVVALGIRLDLAIVAAFGAAFLVLYRHPMPHPMIGAVARGVGTAIYVCIRRGMTVMCAAFIA